MSKHRTWYPNTKQHEFCLGTSSFAGAPKLHALLGGLAPAVTGEIWYSRSPVSQRNGKAYMSILTNFHDNLSDAVGRWEEPDFGA
jgi:hypothetical protein